MAQRNDFRQVSTFDLRPVFISLGLSQSSFNKPADFPNTTRLFDAALNADSSHPDTLWLFKGSDYLSFNLRTGDFEGDPKPIAGNFGGDSWDPRFSPGIDGAVWAGAPYPNLWYFFKDHWFIRLNSSKGGNWLRDEGPRGVRGYFESTHWTAEDGSWKTPGVPVALHGLSPKFDHMIHFFKDGQYVRHNLSVGWRHFQDPGPIPIKNAWNLPDEFLTRIDLAFYGTGTEEQHIFFFSGTQCAQYDTRTDKTINVCPIDERFPAFGQFMVRPQLFLVEDYRLEAYVGPPRLGSLLETRNVPPGTETKTLMVTETIDSIQTTLRQSLLESQNASVVNDFNTQMDKSLKTKDSNRKYGYHFRGSAHGDAGYTGLGGEVNANAQAEGGTNTVRSSVAESIFETIGSQVTESAQQVNQRTYDSSTAIEHKERVLKQEEIVLKNPTDRLRVFEFYQQLQPYITLLVLKSVRIAYADGTEAPRVLPISRLAQLLNDTLADHEERQKLTQFIASELSTVEDFEGKIRSLIQTEAQASAAMMLVPNPTSTFLLQHANGHVQTITTHGLAIKAAWDWIKPTLTMIAVEAPEQ